MSVEEIARPGNMVRENVLRDFKLIAVLEVDRCELPIEPGIDWFLVLRAIELSRFAAVVSALAFVIVA